MATPQQIIPKLEGMVGYMTGSADGGSIQGSTVVTEWVRMLKALLEGPDFRYLTDLEFLLLDDVDTTGENISDATHVIAALIEMVTTIATDGAGWITFEDAQSITFAGTAALNNAVVAVVHVSDVTTTGTSEFTPAIWLAGKADGGAYSTTGLDLPNTGLCVSGDGNDAGAFAANACRVFVLYRT